MTNTNTTQEVKVIGNDNISPSEEGKLKIKRREHTDRYLRYYYKNHDKMLERRKKDDKLYNERHKQRLYCEQCEKYFPKIAVVKKALLDAKTPKDYCQFE